MKTFFKNEHFLSLTFFKHLATFTILVAKGKGFVFRAGMIKMKVQGNKIGWKELLKVVCAILFLASTPLFKIRFIFPIVKRTCFCS